MRTFKVRTTDGRFIIIADRIRKTEDIILFENLNAKQENDSMKQFYTVAIVPVSKLICVAANENLL